MKTEEMKKTVEIIQTKLGDDSSAIIADDLAQIIADNESMNNDISEKEKIISEKDDLNTKLVQANSSLLQQVGSEKTVNENNLTTSVTKTTDDEKISWNDCFDKKGNFIK